MTDRRTLIAGNWKMNGDAAARAELEAIAAAPAPEGVETLICPPAILIRAYAGAGVPLGGQDCHAAASGAHTGDTSAEMLAEAGAAACIVGHSERRADHGETDAMVAAKAEAAWRAGLTAIICVGETEAERDAGEALAVVSGQVTASTPSGATAANTVIAYEPVWAIGTGRTPSTDDIDEMHRAIRATLADKFGADAAEGMRILYGGSMKPGNAAEICAIADVDGGLVGGASLKAADFLGIISAAASAR